MALQQMPRSPSLRSRHLAAARLLVCLFCAGVLTACSSVRYQTSGQAAADAAKVRSQELQLMTMRLADEYVGSVLGAADIVEQREELAVEGKLQLAAWKLQQASAAYTNASGQDTAANVLDLLVLASLSRRLVERRDLDAIDAEPLLAAHREMESKLWAFVESRTTPEAVAQLRAAVDDWAAKHPDVRVIGSVRFTEFVKQSADGQPGAPRGLFGRLGLDPLQGLDPAVREIEETRQFAERALYLSQRLPILLDLQLRLTTQSLVALPESQRAVDSAERASLAAESIAATAAQLPDVIAREREALLASFWGGLEDNEGRSRELLSGLQEALAQGDRTAQSLRDATRVLDTFVARFQRPERAGALAGRPFDINEYTRAAAEIGRTLSELESLASRIDAQAPGLQRAMAAASAETRSLLDAVFLRLAALVGLAALSALLVGIALRRLGRGAGRA